ncbi:hypothetical protein [Hallella absiana]|uniref:hypothetical protein n=2 Tax=Hallella absiana TaxID=2925336 RepID=UPI0021C6F3A6|nr:hypothetical protein [Hallella absiana]
MSNKKNKIKPVIVSVINQVKKKNEDFFSKLSSAAKRDQSYLRQVLKGKRNFTMDVLQDIGTAYDMRYIIVPVPESPQLKRLIAGYGEEQECYWRVPLGDGSNALLDFLINAAGNKGNYEEIWKAAFMFNAVLARAASTEGSREDIIEMLSSGTEKLLDLIWRLTH